MPEIRCPNCGLTINLANRRETDAKLITDAVRGKARSFTDLLRVTRLPRKTLNMRLRDMCETGVLARADRLYQLVGVSASRKTVGSRLGMISRSVHDGRMKVVVMSLVFLIGFPTLSLAFAMMYKRSPVIVQRPEVMGTFNAAIEVHDVEGLFAWQAIVGFDSDKLKVMEARCGDVFSVDYPFFVSASDIGEDLFLVGASLKSGDTGVDVQESGVLAVITFGYFEQDYVKPELLQTCNAYENVLYDSNANRIPLLNSTLTLTSMK